MNCMKCGREIPAGQVFCDGCLEVMKRYPVKPDTAVQLPRRSMQSSPKKQVARRRQLSPEEQIPLLKRSCRRLVFCVVVLSLLLAAIGVAVFLQLQGPDSTLPTVPNYTNNTTDTTG